MDDPFADLDYEENETVIDDEFNIPYAGYFRRASISRLAVLVHFAENNFVDHCNVSNTTAGLRDRCYNTTPTFFRE